MYGFPESHAIAFALLIAVSGYLKRHHPAPFLCALLNSQPMGFYSPAVLIADAERHGVAVLSPDIVASGYDHRMERLPDGRWAVRLGLRLVRGIGAGERGQVEAARAGGPYADLRDAVWRLGLRQDALVNLAAVGAFAPLGLSRRAAIWAVGVIEERPDLLVGEPLVIPDLPPLTEEEETRLDLTLMGCTPGRRHLMRHHRDLMDRWGVTTASGLDTMGHGERVRVGGAVAVRQRPGTSRGVVFLTLEDETGTINVVVMPDVFAAARATIRTASLLAVEGWVQRAEGVTHVRAGRVRAFGQQMGAEALLSKQFV